VPPTSSTSKPPSSKLKKVLLIAIPIVLIVLFIAYQLTGFGYTVANIRCGHDPVVASKSFKGIKSYYAPGSSFYRFYAHDSGNSYYCSEAEARASGYTRTP